MPPAVVAAVAYIAGAITLYQAIFIAAVSLYGNYQARKLKRKAQQAASLLDNARSQSFRQPITNWRLVYGQVLVGGPITFMHTTDNNKYLNVLVTVAAHEVESIGDVYFSDERIPQESDGTVRGRWAGYAEIYKGLGTTAGDASLLAALQANCPGVWTANHRQDGRAKLYVRLKYNQQLLRAGLPQFRAVVKGRKLYDPRTGQSAYTNNWALAVRDYLTDKNVGLAAASIDHAGVVSLLQGETLHPTAVFTRGSTATYFDKNGVLQTAAANVPRFDYDPVALTLRGLLVEESRTNLVAISEDMSGTGWTRSGILAFGSGSILNAATAPDGTVSMDKIVEDTTNTTHEIQRSGITITAGQTMGASFFVKAAERTLGDIRIKGSTGQCIGRFDLGTGTISAVNSGSGVVSDVRIEAVGGGIYRVAVSGVATATDTNCAVSINLRDAGGNATYTGDGASGFYVWGAQLEVGPTRSSYIKTTGATVTRSADNATVALGSWFNAAEGTLYVEFDMRATTIDSTPRVIAAIGDNTTFNETIYLSRTTSNANVAMNVQDGGVTQVSSVIGTVTPNVLARAAFAYKLNDFAGSLNGAAAVTDTAGTLPTVNTVALGKASWASGNYLNGHVLRLYYFPNRLANTDLQTLASAGELPDEIDDNSFVAAANVSDESVAVQAVSSTFTPQPISPPPPTFTATPNGSSGIVAQRYLYSVTFVTAAGETVGSHRSARVFADLFDDTTAVQLTNIPIGPAGVTARKIYRGYGFSDAFNMPNQDAFFTRVGTLNDNSTTSFSDSISNPGGGGIPTTNTALPGSVTLNAAGIYIRTGDAVQLSTTGTLPGGLAPSTTYYYITSGGGRDNFATTLANARAGTAIAMTSAGSGTHTVTRTAEPRYTASGVVNTEDKPRDILQEMLTAGAGRLLFVNGKWTLYAGAYRPPMITLDENDLDGNPQVTARLGRRSIFNAVKGVYVSPGDSWQPTDFPPVTNATYLAEDNNERIWQDIELPYTLSSSAAQRLAKIQLEQQRQQITTKWPCKLSAFRTQAGDVVGLSNSRLGWSAKPFEIVDFEFALRMDAEIPRLGIDLFLRETASTVFDWNSGLETTVDPAPDTNLPDAFTVEAPVLDDPTSGTADLYLRLDGTVFSRIRVSWAQHPNIFVQNGGRIEVRYRRSNVTTWSMAAPASGDATFLFILDVQDGQEYLIQARAVNNQGAASTWEDAQKLHTVVGKTAPPSDVTGLTASQNGTVAVLKWNQVTDIDLAGYEVRYGPRTTATWDNGIPLTKINRGEEMTSAAIPPGDWLLLIKSRDTSGNFAVNAATTTLLMSSALDVIFQRQQAPDWLGTKTNFYKHWTGVLIPESTLLANAMTDAQLWDTFVYSPFAQCIYEAPEIDIGFDDTCRIWGSIDSELGPGATGIADPALQIDFRTAAGAYDGFEAWTIGDRTGRFFKQRLVLTTADGAAKILGFLLTVDQLEDTDQGTATIAPGGTVVNYNKTFHVVPRPQVTAIGGTALYASPSSETTTGFTCNVFNSAGTDVGGTINWQATGV